MDWRQDRSLRHLDLTPYALLSVDAYDTLIVRACGGRQTLLEAVAEAFGAEAVSFCGRIYRSTTLLCVPWEGALFSLVKVQAGKLLLQPEALGAGQEATNGPKHLKKQPLLGGSGPCGPQRE